MTKIKKFTPKSKTGKGNSPSPETKERNRVKEALKPQKAESKTVKPVAPAAGKEKESK